MKKLLVIILIAGSGSTFAQLSGGIKGGLNLSNQKWKVTLMGQ